jgi:hypothetical protein
MPHIQRLTEVRFYRPGDVPPPERGHRRLPDDELEDAIYRAHAIRKARLAAQPADEVLQRYDAWWEAYSPSDARTVAVAYVVFQCGCDACRKAYPATPPRCGKCDACADERTCDEPPTRLRG